MPYRSALPHARSDRRPTYNYSQVMDELGCSKRHVYNLFNRGELQGYYIGNGRGLRIYKDSVEELKRLNADIFA